MVRLNRSELKRDYAADREQTLVALEQGVEAGDLRLGSNVKLSDVFEAFTDKTVDDLFHMRKSRLEAVDFVGLSDFAIATGLFLLDEANRGFNVPSFIADKLVTKREAASTKLSQKIPYFPLPASDNAYRKLEGKPYNRVGAASGYVESTPPEDNGFIIEATRELLRDDKTGGGIAMNINRQGQGLGIYREKDILGTVFGTQGSWKFGINDAIPTTSYNTYATSAAPYVNSISNTLTSWKSIDAALLQFSKIGDPVTGQILGIPTNLTMVVPWAIWMRAKNFLNATDVQEVDNSTGTATVRTTFTNPITSNPQQVTINLLSNQWVYQVTSSDSTWFLGDFTEAFVLNNGWEQEQLEQGKESNAFFESNIIYRQRYSYNQKAYPYMPFRVLKNT